MSRYILPFLTSFLLTVTLMVFFILVARKIKWKGRKSQRHIHKKGVYRIGGIAMIVSFGLALIFNKELYISLELWGVMIASLLVLIFGVLDDIKEIFWKFQLSFQIAIAVFIFVMGIRIYYVTNPLNGGILSLDGPWVIFSVTLVICWIILAMNSMNWLDGIDGLSGGVSLISALTILLLSLKAEVNQPPVAIICSAFSGCLLGFLIFNFHPSRVIAGTSGAMFMGFTLAVLAIFSGTKIATALLVMAIPVIDLLWVIMERFRKKKSLFLPDKNHLHYKLLDLGWSQKKIAIYYYLFTFLIALIALNTRAIGKGITLILAFFILATISVILNKKLAEKNYQRV